MNVIIVEQLTQFLSNKQKLFDCLFYHDAEQSRIPTDFFYLRAALTMK